MIALEPPRGMLPADAALTEAEAWRAVGLSRAGLTRFLRMAQAAVGLRGEVEVLLAGDPALRRLNRQYRGKNKATDVLSFPGAPEMAAEHAGDLAISLETAARQAVEQGHTLRDEVRVLLLHGLLHLQGMDHEVDGGEMAARELELRRRLRLRSGLIARVEGGGTVGIRAETKTKIKARAKTKARAKAKTRATATALTQRARRGREGREGVGGSGLAVKVGVGRGVRGKGR